MRTMFALGSTEACTFPASVAAVWPESFRAPSASTSRVIRSFWIVASWRCSSVDEVRLGVSSNRIVA